MWVNEPNAWSFRVAYLILIAWTDLGTRLSFFSIQDEVSFKSLDCPVSQSVGRDAGTSTVSSALYNEKSLLPHTVKRIILILLRLQRGKRKEGRGENLIGVTASCFFLMWLVLSEPVYRVIVLSERVYRVMVVSEPVYRVVVVVVRVKCEEWRAACVCCVYHSQRSQLNLDLLFRAQALELPQKWFITKSR